MQHTLMYAPCATVLLDILKPQISDETHELLHRTLVHIHMLQEDCVSQLMGFYHIESFSFR